MGSPRIEPAIASTSTGRVPVIKSPGNAIGKGLRQAGSHHISERMRSSLIPERRPAVKGSGRYRPPPGLRSRIGQAIPVRMENATETRSDHSSQHTGDGQRKRAMSGHKRKRRYTATPAKHEVNVRAIPHLSPEGWRLCTSEDYPIVGTVPKNYIAYGDPEKPGTLGYIAKKGRFEEYARECVTEEIISKIGKTLPLTMANSRLARISKTDVRFLSQDFIVSGKQQLLHGNELAARYFETDTKEIETAFDLNSKQGEHEFYTIENIKAIFEELYPENSTTLKEDFLKMLTFDAFIGAPDRHAMNWGVLSPLDAESKSVRFAPIFDTARGLFREYTDDRLRFREKKDGRRDFLEKYAEKSQPILSTGEYPKPNHFSLIGWIFKNADDPDRGAVNAIIDAIDIYAIEHMLQRYFRRIITQYRMAFIRDLLSLRAQRIREEVQK